MRISAPGKMSFGRYDYAAFLSFCAYAASSVVIPVVLVELAKTLNFPLEAGGKSAGGVLHVARSCAIVAAMLYCGFAAGRWGMRKTLGFSVLLTGTGILLCALSPSYGILLLALLIAGLGEGVIEGLATPFVQELHSDDPGRYINFTHGFWSFGVLFTVLLAGWLLTLGVNWRNIAGGVAVFSLIPGMQLLWKEGKKPYPERQTRINSAKVLADSIKILKTPLFWLFFAAMFLAGGGEFCLTFWCASFIRLDLGGSAWAGGVGTACFALGMFAGRLGSGILVKQKYLAHLVIAAAAAGTVLSLIIPPLAAVQMDTQTKLYCFYFLLVLAGLASAPFWPSVQSYCADRLPELDTTMLFVLLSCAGIPGCGVFTYLMGVIGDKVSLTAAFYLVTFCYGLLALLIFIDAYVLEKRRMR